MALREGCFFPSCCWWTNIFLLRTHHRLQKFSKILHNVGVFIRLIRASGDFLLLLKCCARNPLINIELNHKWWGQKRGLSTNSSVVTYDRLSYGKRNHNDHWFEWKIKLFHFSWNYAIFFFVLYLLPPCKWFFLDSLWFGWNEHTFARRQKKTITAIPPIETMTAVYDGEVLPLTKVSRNEMGAYLCNISAIIHTIYLFTYWAIRYFCFVYIILQVSVSMR